MIDPSALALLAKLVDEVAGLRADLASVRQAPVAPASATEPEGLWDAEGLAAFLHCSKSWVYDAEAAGKLPSLHIGGMLRFEPEAIRRLLRGGRTGAKIVRLTP